MVLLLLLRSGRGGLLQLRRQKSDHVRYVLAGEQRICLGGCWIIANRTCAGQMVFSYSQTSEHAFTCSLLTDLLDKLQLLLLEMLLDVVVTLRVVRKIRVQPHPLEILMAIVRVGIVIRSADGAFEILLGKLGRCHTLKRILNVSAHLHMLVQ